MPNSAKVNERLTRYQADNVELPRVDVAFRRAAALGNVEDVEFFITNFLFDLEAKSSGGLDAVELAEMNGHEGVVHVIREHMNSPKMDEVESISSESSTTIFRALNENIATSTGTSPSLTPPPSLREFENQKIIAMFVNFVGNCLESCVAVYKASNRLTDEEKIMMQNAMPAFYQSLLALATPFQRSHLLAFVELVENNQGGDKKIVFKILEQILRNNRRECFEATRNVVYEQMVAFEAPSSQKYFDKRAEAAIEVLSKSWQVQALLINEELTLKSRSQSSTSNSFNRRLS